MLMRLLSCLIPDCLRLRQASVFLLRKKIPVLVTYVSDAVRRHDVRRRQRATDMTYFLTSLPTEVREVVIHRLSLGIVRHSDEHQSCFFVPIHSVGHVFDYLYAATSMRRFPAALPTTPSLDANNLLGIPRRCYLREFLPPFFSVIGSQSYGRTFRHRLTRRAFSCRVERFFRPKRVHRSCIFSSQPLLSRVVEKTYFFRALLRRGK